MAKKQKKTEKRPTFSTTIVNGKALRSGYDKRYLVDSFTYGVPDYATADEMRKRTEEHYRNEDVRVRVQRAANGTFTVKLKKAAEVRKPGKQTADGALASAGANDVSIQDTVVSAAS